MKVLYLVTLLISIVFISASAQEITIQNIKSRNHISLNGRWNYIIDPYEMGYYDYRYELFDQSPSGKGGFYDDRQQKDKSELIEYDFSYSPTLNVPGDWNSQAEKLSLYEGTIWYRKKFNIEPAAGKHYVLYFGAVNYEAHVYLNGQKLGMHKGGFTPFYFDVTDKLAKGENFVVVKADNVRKKTEVPTVNTDWWNYGGITRDVYLAEFPETYISDYKVQLSGSKTNLIEGFVQLTGKTPSGEITVSIPELKISTTAKSDESGRAAISIPVKQLTLWSPEQPKLYNITIRGGKDEVTDKVGFRTIATKGKDILLNGKPVFLRGICLHDENPLLKGRLRSEGDMRMMLSWAKELNCNFVRLAHYTHNEQMIRLADEMGLMVWAEIPVYWTIAWENEETFRNARQQMTDMIQRDKNRAAVVIWSIGNETPLSEPRLKFMSNMADHVRSLDNSRLVAAALEVHRNGNEIILDDPLGEKLDLVSFNEYVGWYGKENPKEITNYHFNIKYKKPVVITEFGGGALAGFHADDDTRWSEEYQESLYKNQLAMLSKLEGLRGITPWILADFRSPRRQHPIYQDFWNRKGLISENGTKKKAWHVLKNFYVEMEQKYK